ncbi:MAG: hypothetical protein HY261_06605 [Chloroflexi bacterium]|nr:hypothetical protein [Chloroflexota bacterium]
MADTRKLKDEVEEHIRKVLQSEFGMPFRSAKLPLVSGGIHEFDAVSLDDHIICSIKSSSGKTSGGNHPAGKVNDSIAELYFLSLVQGEQRILIVTDPGFHRILMGSLKGKIAPGVAVRLIPLPAQLQEDVQRIQMAASAEVTPTRH